MVHTDLMRVTPTATMLFQSIFPQFLHSEGTPSRFQAVSLPTNSHRKQLRNARHACFPARGYFVVLFPA
jgi:hypothetical protein